MAAFEQENFVAQCEEFAGTVGDVEHYMHFNFCRIHQSLHVTPAMEAGVSDHVWSLDEIIALLD
jgi:hypothetical protein